MLNLDNAVNFSFSPDYSSPKLVLSSGHTTPADCTDLQQDWMSDLLLSVLLKAGGYTGNCRQNRRSWFTRSRYK